MKRNIITLLAVTAIAVCGLLVGCKSADRTLFTESQWATNFVAEHQTVKTQVVTITVTNDAGQVATSQVPTLVTNTVAAHAEVKPVAWVPNQQAVDTVHLVGGVFGPYGTLGATAITAILGGIAAYRGKKYKNAAISIAQGVQQVVELFPEHKDAIIDVQKHVQDSDGTRSVVDRLLSLVVSKPTPPGTA